MLRQLKYCSNFSLFNNSNNLQSIIEDIGYLAGVAFAHTDSLLNAEIFIANISQTEFQLTPDELNNSNFIDILLLKETTDIEYMHTIKLVNERYLTVICYYNDAILEGQNDAINILKKRYVNE